jgi:hypothetical protein
VIVPVTTDDGEIDANIRFIDTYIEKTEFGNLCVGLKFRNNEGQDIMKGGMNSKTYHSIYLKDPHARIVGFKCRTHKNWNATLYDL